MTTWPRPVPFSAAYLDAETAPTTLAMIKDHFGEIPSTLDLFIGNMGGSLGEISAVAILIGLVYLLVKKSSPGIFRLAYWLRFLYLQVF